MIKYNDKTSVLTFTGNDEKVVREYAKKHKLTFKEVVYLAIMNGIATGRWDSVKKAKKG